jgi:long-chain acyl-CoA synthetase
VGGKAPIETLAEIIRVSATRYGQKIALTGKTGFRRETWTYAYLLKTVDCFASYLHTRGVERGDRVALCAPNQPSWVAAFWGCLIRGAIVVPLDIQSSAEFMAKVIKNTGCKLILGTASTASTLQDLGVDLVLLEDLVPLLKERVVPPECPVQPDDPAEIVFTSGTTGDPKGVVLTHRNILSNVESGAIFVPGKPSSRLLSLLPLSHMLEQNAGLLIPLRGGGTIVYPSSRKPGVIARVLREEKITCMIVVPQVLMVLMNSIEREVRRLGKEAEWVRAHRIAPRLPMFLRRQLFRSALSSLGGQLEFVVCGGSFLAPALAKKWENLGIKVLPGYGTTETSATVSSNSLRRRKLDSVGRVLPGQQVRIAGDGEIQVKGANVFVGYWRNSEATKRVMEDGWYKTGDLGYFDEDEFLHFKGRKKNLIVLADGRNVYPEDIEPILNRELDREAGEDAIVIGRDTGQGSTEVHAVLLVRDSSKAEQVIRSANSQLAEYQRIRGFTLWHEGDFPRTPTLRVQRHLVEERLARDSQEQAPVTTSPPPPTIKVSDTRRILSEVCGIPAEKLDNDSRIGDDLGLDSLGRVELLSAIEAELGLYIDEQEVGSETTVADLEQLVLHSGIAPSVNVRQWPLALPGRLIRRAVHSCCLFPILWALARPVTRGRENLEGLTGPMLIAANHNSHLDSLTVFYALPTRFRSRLAVAAADDYFFQNSVLAWMTSLFVNGFPFAREGNIRNSLEYCSQLLDQGWSILIYPEGTRSLTGEMAPFKPGVGLLSVELGVPILPVRLLGLERILPKGRAIPRRANNVQVRIGRPLYFPTGTSHLKATRAIEKAVESL